MNLASLAAVPAAAEQVQEAPLAAAVGVLQIHFVHAAEWEVPLAVAVI